MIADVAWLKPQPPAAPRALPAPITRWRSFDARLLDPGPVHTRHDQADGGKAVTWPPGLDGHALEDLVYLTAIAADAIRRYWTPAILVVTEGEKAADAVAAAGLAAVGTVCGAPSTPGSAVVALLARWPIILAPDNDDVGRAHMDRLGRLLEEAGVPRLAVVRPPADAPAGWDLADVSADDVRELVGGAAGRWIGPVCP